MEEISEEDSNLTLQLLEAIWQIFAEKKVVRMHTKVLLDALKKIEEAPWEEANNGREIDAYWLREKLKGFLPRPANPEEAAALRRSRQWREGKARPSRATRRTICAKPGGATSSERRRPRQPKRPAPRRAWRRRSSAADQPLETEDRDRALRRMARTKTGSRTRPTGRRRAQRTRTGAAADPPERGEAVGEA